MRLPAAERDLLQSARIGMLALNAEPAPVVTAGAYFFGGNSVWLTTSRFAHKVKLIHENPRASFLVTRQQTSLLLQGMIDTYDLVSLGGQLRAALTGPRFYSGMAGYALKNLSFVAGYVAELDRVPREWWPQNRLVLRFRIQRSRRFEAPAVKSADPAYVPGISRDVARRLARTALAHTCWKARSGLLMEPCYWTAQNGIVAVAFAPDGQRLEDEQPGAVVVEKHHPFRPTQMVGACLRGRLVPDRNAEEAVAVRYGLEDRDIGASFRVEPARILSWRGFETQSQAA